MITCFFAPDSRVTDHIQPPKFMTAPEPLTQLTAVQNNTTPRQYATTNAMQPERNNKQRNTTNPPIPPYPHLSSNAYLAV
jgi:hypothetical protein